MLKTPRPTFLLTVTPSSSVGPRLLGRPRMSGPYSPRGVWWTRIVSRKLREPTNMQLILATQFLALSASVWEELLPKN